MTEAQQNYMEAFYDCLEDRGKQLGWSLEEHQHQIINHATDQRDYKYDSLAKERFTKMEWLGIWNFILFPFGLSNYYKGTYGHTPDTIRVLKAMDAKARGEGL